MNVRRTLVVLASLTVALVGLPAGHSNTAAAADDAPPALTNLAHLDWLGDTVDPPDQADHTTYRLAEEPEIGVLWTYAEPKNGVLTRVGGGKYDPATNTYEQGAFNADDVSRAAVVYIRHWVATGSVSSRDAAYPYAEPRNGVLTRVGGGSYDPATDTYGQGAFNADDVSRAAVVYIRHWVATGSPSSRDGRTRCCAA